MEFVQNIFRAAIDAVLPNKLVSEALKVRKCLNQEILELKSVQTSYKLNKNVYIVAFGKASCGMTSAAEKLLSDHVVKGIASIPVGSIEILRKNNLLSMLPMETTKIEYCQGAANNLPDSAANETALKIKNLCTNLKESDLLLVLISGGGSALLPCPPSPVTLPDKTTVVKLLSSRGANISELNTVRQQLSELKAGRLAQLAYPAKVISLIFSDIVGNDLEFVASGPTVPSTTSPKDALTIIEKFCAKEEIPENIKKFLDNKISAPDANSRCSFDHVINILLADSRMALQAAKRYSDSMNIPACVVTNDISGESNAIGRLFAQLTSDLISSKSNVIDNLHNINERFGSLLPKRDNSDFFADNYFKFINDQRKSEKPKFCLIWGGETTVTVRGRGLGGRNQEMVLAYLHEILKLNLPIKADQSKGWNFVFCSAGTDGQDGPTDATGAVVSKSVLPEGICFDDLSEYLNNNDSYSFFRQFINGACHLKSGLTGTNVMDIQILYLEKF